MFWIFAVKPYLSNIKTCWSLTHKTPPSAFFPLYLTLQKVAALLQNFTGKMFHIKVTKKCNSVFKLKVENIFCKLPLSIAKISLIILNNISSFLFNVVVLEFCWIFLYWQFDGVKKCQQILFCSLRGRSLSVTFIDTFLTL